MRRLWLLLLLFVLPLQMSWAAVHYCDDELLLSAMVESASTSSHSDDSHAAEQKANDKKAEKIADACCGAAHGCHGLHHLIAEAGIDLHAAAVSQMPVQSCAALFAAELLSRLERPKWSAA